MFLFQLCMPAPDIHVTAAMATLTTDHSLPPCHLT